MFFPKARRCLAYLTASSRAPCARPTADRGDADAAAVERAESDFQALAFFAQAIFERDFAIVEDDFYRGRGALAHFFFVASGS